MTISIISSIYYGFLSASIISFAHLFSDRVSDAFYKKSRKKIENKWNYILSGRSKCDICQKNIPFLYVIPIVGYLFTRGKCIHCRSQISYKYFIEELFVFFYGFSIYFILVQTSIFHLFFLLFYLFLGYFISFIDLKHFLIPTEALLAFLIVSLLEYFTLNSGKGNLILDFSIPICWSLFFGLLVYLQPGKMGFADIYIVGVMTFTVGFPKSLFLPTFGSFFAIIYFLIKNRNIPWNIARKNKIPFGLFLYLAFLFMKIIPIPDFI